MIATLTGTIRVLTSDKCVIDVNGVGYALNVTLNTSRNLSVGSTETLFTSLIVREDSLTLFAFTSQEEKELFELLQTVTGIGPKVALAITGALSAEQLMTAIAREDIAAIEKIPGIGKKGAQRLILELKGKVVAHGSNSTVLPTSEKREMLLAALMNLGFTSKDADKAVTTTWSSLTHSNVDPETVELSDLLKTALQSGA